MTAQELRIAAQAAREFPPGHGHSYFADGKP